MSIEGVYRPTSRNLFEEIRRENFEENIVEKGLLLPTNDPIETRSKFELPLTPSREFSKI